MAPEQQDSSLPSPEKLSARLNLAERFLDEQLLPRIKEKSLTVDDIPGLYNSFCQENFGLGDDFELLHSRDAAWKRDVVNKSIAEQDPSKLPLDAPDIVVAMGFIETLVFGYKGRKPYQP